MNITGAKPQLSPDELTLHLIASGLIKLAEKVKNNKVPKLPYEREIQRGLDRVVVHCLLHGKKPPQGIPDLISWCSKPLSEWFPELPEGEILSNDKLLDGQNPTELCEEWAVTGSDVEAEITQKQLLLNVIGICRLENAQDSYVAFRRLLISKPVLTEFELLQRCTEPSLQLLQEQIKGAYEKAPESYALNGYFHCCACGNIMLLTVEEELVCIQERCRAKNASKSSRQIPVKHQVYWLKRGLRRFIAAPGVAELRLADKLEKLGIQVQLWHNFDAYDLRIVFPDGEAWAVDVKDWVNPFLLARKIEQEKPPIPNDGWTKGYFVFPNHRLKQRSDYKRAFCNHCRLPKHIKVRFENEMVRDVKKKLARC